MALVPLQRREIIRQQVKPIFGQIQKVKKRGKKNKNKIELKKKLLKVNYFAQGSYAPLLGVEMISRQVQQKINK